MLPNWLYGKSKSKLASILGGGGGGAPADYNQVKAQVAQNAEDIITLSNALDDKAALTQITNPNILHNPWFQVNQRGATTISSSGYFVDRWYLSPASTGATTFTLNSDGTITIDNSLGEENAYFVQRRTSKTRSRITSRKVTLSIMLSDGTIYSGTGTFSGTETITYYNGENFMLQSTPQSAQLFTLRVKPGKTITIKALKLELGEVSTLAMDTAPDMATELFLCQRYFEKIIVFEHNILDVQASYDRDYYITPKRTKGTLTAYSVNNTAGKISFYINNQWEDGDYNELAWDSPLNNTIRFGAQIPAGSFFKGAIDIDAEL